jgi:hypothetical protein
MFPIRLTLIFLSVPPVSERGEVKEIIGKFCDADQLCSAVDPLRTLLYRA